MDGVTAADTPGFTDKYLTFRLAEEDYGLEILKVQKIIKMQSITKVPRTPSHVKGVINLRGKVIPIIDLRAKFGMQSVECTRKTCIVVVQLDEGALQLTMGVVVDEVSEVLGIQASDIAPSPSLSATVNTDFILGMAKTKDGVKILLDIDRVLSAAEVAALSEAA